MFKNLKITAMMSSPICAIEPISLDAIISAAKAMEIVGDDYYSGKNVCGSKEMIDGILSKIFDKKYDVYCASIGIGENREFIGSWSKRWDTRNDGIVKQDKKGKHRADTGSGYFKNYHMPMILKSYKNIVFYARGDKEELKRLLDNNIHSVGKKRSQGYGRISKWVIEEIGEDNSIVNEVVLMRHIPFEHKDELGDIKHYVAEKPLIPPYWRNDNIVKCICPI
jgi:CRISPR type IV-associated protein Csf3